MSSTYTTDTEGPWSLPTAFNLMSKSISAQSLPNYTLTPAQNGMIITTEWSGLPVIPTNLPDGFTCTIAFYAGANGIPWDASTLPVPMFILPGSSQRDPAATFRLEKGQSCILCAASSCLADGGGTCTWYFVIRGS